MSAVITKMNFETFTEVSTSIDSVSDVLVFSVNMDTHWLKMCLSEFTTMYVFLYTNERETF